MHSVVELIAGNSMFLADAFKSPRKMDRDQDPRHPVRSRWRQSRRFRTLLLIFGWRVFLLCSFGFWNILESMPTFESRPLEEAPVSRLLKRHPSLFGVPFILLMVGASFAMTSFTQTRYDLQSQRVKQVCTPLHIRLEHSSNISYQSCPKKRRWVWRMTGRSLIYEKNTMYVLSLLLQSTFATHHFE